jgi:RecA/RadA recombinase
VFSLTNKNKNKMAKKVSAKFEVSKIGTILDNISKTIPIQIEKEIKEKEFISTGVYILDAALSGKLIGGGVTSNRITAFAGESGAGKSFIAYSITRNAQKAGYFVIFIDTEQSIDLDDLNKYGVSVDLNKFRLVRSNKVEDINMTLTKLLDDLKEQKLNNVELPKIMIILDSLGAMASNKEKEDLLKGDIKQDMTKAKAIGSMFRSISSDLGYLDIPLIVNNHTYQTLDLFSVEKLKGGNALLYTASAVAFMSKSKLKTGQEDSMDLGQSGITVSLKVVKNRLAKPKKIKFDISFISGMNPYTGLEEFCRPEYYDIIGIAKGKEEVDKSTGEIKFIHGGNRWYVSHLNKSVTSRNLLTSEVFTQEILEKMAPIVNDYFRFKSIDEIEEVEKKFNSLIDDEDESNGFSDVVDAADLFD